MEKMESRKDNKERTFSDSTTQKERRRKKKQDLDIAPCCIDQDFRGK